MLTAFQVAIPTGAILGGLLVDGQGPAGVFVFAAIAALGGAFLIAAAGRRPVTA